jgi:hypothetical protein
MKTKFRLIGWALLLIALVSGCDVKPSKGRITVKTVPEGAQLIVNGEPKGQTPAVLAELDAGNYVLELRADGFQRSYESVTLQQGQALDVTVSMKMATGLVLLKSEPAGAAVMIDGFSTGVTPMLLTDLALGTYTFELSSPGLLSKKVEVDVEGRQPQQVMVKLGAYTAKLFVESQPEGAEVRLNGVVKGTAPLMIEEVQPGEVTVSVSKDGYETYEQTMEVESLKSYEVAATLKSAPSILSIRTEPAGAQVIIGDKVVGVTPLNLQDLEDGSHEVTVSLEGYADQSQTIVLEPNMHERLEFTLEQDSGTLELITEPALVKVFLDGTLYGTTELKEGSDAIAQPLALSLKAGKTYTVLLVRDGFVARSLEFSPAVGQVTTKHEVMRPIFIYDTKITTRQGIIKCRMEYKLPNGDIYFERFPGVFDTVKAADIILVRPIRLEDPENREARLLLQANQAATPSE